MAKNENKAEEVKEVIIETEHGNFKYADGKLIALKGNTLIEGTVCDYIRVKVFERKDKEGKKFLAYKGICSNKRYLDLSFTMDCGNPTNQKDFVLIGADYNVDTNRMYPRIYVKSFSLTIDFNREIKDTLQYVKSCE